MKLSFILAAYKCKYLSEAIKSILHQTYRDFELVVVDDCSPEGLQEIVADFQDERIRYVRNEKNLGGTNLVAAWNKALEQARGEWCVLASDDDIYLSDYAERMLAISERYPQCNVFHCRTAVIDDEGMVSKIAEKRPEFESCADLLYARGVKRCLQTAPEFMFKREALQRIGGFVNFPLAWYSDDATWLALAREHGVVCASEVLFHWRYSGINISSRFDITAKKVQAAEEYKTWLRKFIPTVKPLSHEDGMVLKYAAEHIFEAVDQQTLYDLDDTRFWLWLRILIKEQLPPRLRLRTIRNRMRKVFHI